MFKKLLVALLALTIIVGMFSVAMATKQPNEAKKLVQIMPPGSLRPSIGQNAISERPVMHQPAVPATKTAQSGLAANRPVEAPCTDQSYIGALAYFWDGVDGAATRFTSVGSCTLMTFYLDFYSGGVNPAAAGLMVYVWNDDGFGLPGSVVTSVNVPHASVVYNPTLLTINLAPANIVMSGDFHVGYMLNDASDGYRPLSDNGTTGTDRSTGYDAPSASWMDMITYALADYNWDMTLNTCCAGATPGDQDCASHVYDMGIYYRWGGKEPKAVRFSAGNSCTLMTASLGFSAGGQLGTGGIDVTVYADAAGIPGAVLGLKHVAHAQVVLGGSTVVNMQSLNMVFNNVDYHVGYSITNPVTDDYQLRSDDGLSGSGRSTVYDLVSGTWFTSAVAYAPDEFNWLISDSTCCSVAPPVCWTESYAGAAAYYWPIPDVYGDDFFNMRFTNATKCTLKTIDLAFYAGASVGTPGATVYLWRSDGTYPTSVITSFPVNPVVNFYPALTSVDVTAANLIFAGEYHIGYTPIYNNPSDVLAILSDNGATATGRGGEKYGGGWGLMADDWGLDVAFLISVDKCCQPVGYCEWVCDPNDQWPAFAHDYARTGQSGLKLGDLCGIYNAWTYTPSAAKPINMTAPVIVNDRVYVAFDDRIDCVNLLTGVNVWSTKTIPAYAALINTGLRSFLTIEDGAIYFGTGSVKGFVKADAATGTPIWVRHASSNPLPGTPGGTRYMGAVILGNEIYFGDEFAQVYALDKMTGATLYSTQLWFDPPTNTIKPIIYGALTTDGTHLFVPIVRAANAGGGVYSLTPGGGFAVNWYFVDGFQSILYTGFYAAPSFRCDNLFVHSYAGVQYNGYQGYRQNLDPLTGLAKWPDYYLMGAAWSSPVATIGGMTPLAVFANINNGYSGNVNSHGPRAVTFSNTTAWAVPGSTASYDNNMFVGASVTCDPYVVFGTADLLNLDGHWRIADGNTGEILIDYYLSGYVMGTAIARGSDGDYLVAAVRTTGFGAGSGKLFAFKNGPARPRMYVPELYVEFPATNTSEPIPVQRIDNDAIMNTGCQTLNFTGTLEAGAPPTARQITSVNPALAQRANGLANRMVDYRVEDLAPAVSAKSKMFAGLMQADEAGEVVSASVSVKPAKANSSKLAPPSWVSWIAPVGGVGAVAPAGSTNFTFQFDRSGMELLGQNYYYVDINSNDPDYNLEDPTATPQTYIEYVLPFVYCSLDTGRMAFGVGGGEWYSNRGEFGDGAVTFDFTLDGTSDGGALYEGSVFFMTSMNNAAWNPFGSTVPQDFGYLYPFYVSGTTCGSCTFNTPLPVEYTTNGGVSYSNTIGDLCNFAMIDSMQGTYLHQAGPSMGILVKYREIGTYGADFGAFKLVVMDVINRNATPITGMYYGLFTDWDVASGNNNGNGNIDKSYMYLNEVGTAYGHIGLPLKGSYLGDGIAKALPAYNGRINDNTTEVYPPAERPLDSLYAYIDSRPQGALTYAAAAGGPTGTPADLSYEFALGKANLAGGATHSFGFALFGFANSANLSVDAENLSKFINKYSGFDRGDINNDGVIDLRDVVRLQRYVAGLGAGPVPFKHMGDVNNDGVVDSLDCQYLAAYFFTAGPGPKGSFKF
jgi:hypothetical protein